MKGRRRRDVTDGQTRGESSKRAGKEAVRGHLSGVHLLGGGRAAIRLLRAPLLKF